METTELPSALPRRRGYVEVHTHDETGEPCTINPADMFLSCRYTPTLRTRIRWALAQLFE